MWITNALVTFEGTPTVTSSFCALQSCCGDATVRPFLTGKACTSIGCHGCRTAGKLGPELLYFGIPYMLFPKIVSALQHLQPAMGKLVTRQQYPAAK